MLLKFVYSSQKTINHPRSREISKVFGFIQTCDLGKYLGFPELFMNEWGEKSFELLLMVRLSSWKYNSLSLAGRATLVLLQYRVIVYSLLIF